MNSISVTFVDKIDVDELIKDFKVENCDHFSNYLNEVYKVI